MLEDLAGLGDERDREQIAALRDRLAAARLRVLVAGEAKRGKSTLVNALHSLYRFKTPHTGFELRLVSVGELRHDHSPCLSVCCT